MTRLHHVNLVVPPGRTDEVVAFYRDIFGLTPVAKPGALDPSGAWLQVDVDSQLHLSERDGAPHPAQHFALVVDDFGPTLERLRVAGADWRDAEPVFGGGRGFTRDPVGNLVEVIEALP